MKRIALIALAALTLAACGGRQTDALTRKGSSGKTLEMLVVADPGVYTGKVKALVDSLFRAPLGTLPQPEPQFSVVNIPQASLSSSQMFQMHRNILVLSIDSANADKTFLRRNQWAEPQVVVEVEARSVEGLCRMLRQHEGLIADAIIANEHERVRRAFHGTRNPDLMARAKEHLGFGLTLPEGFTWARSDTGFAWIRKETKDFSQGLLVAVHPYRSEHQFDSVAILDRIDTLMRRYVPGPTEGSHMGLERRVHLGAEIEVRRVDFPGSDFAVQTRGLWRTFGDFMGGPYVCCTALSPDHRQVVDLVGFVYCPRTDRYSKRDLLMQTEGIIYSIAWE